MEWRASGKRASRSQSGLARRGEEEKRRRGEEEKRRRGEEEKRRRGEEEKRRRGGSRLCSDGTQRWSGGAAVPLCTDGTQSSNPLSSSAESAANQVRWLRATDESSSLEAPRS
jgi:hypothetical protein